MYSRSCPNCSKYISYLGNNDRTHFLRAEKNKSICCSCANSIKAQGTKNPFYGKYHSYKTKKKISIAKSGRNHQFFGKTRGPFSEEWKQNMSDSHIGITQSSKTIQKRVYKSLGFSSYKEYRNSLSKWKQYSLDVRRITRQQPLETLENFDKRGRAGTNGAHQVDHIISVHLGFMKNMPAEKVGNINNLRMLPWEENLRRRFGE